MRILFLFGSIGTILISHSIEMLMGINIVPMSLRVVMWLILIVSIFSIEVSIENEKENEELE